MHTLPSISDRLLRGRRGGFDYHGPPPSGDGADRPADVCNEEDCARPVVDRCAYVDRRDRRCPSRWCLEHREVVHGTSYCRRHARVVRVLGDSDIEGELPDVDDRSASLCDFVAGGIERSVLDLLAKDPSMATGTRLETRPMTVAMAGLPRVREWVKTWSVLDSRTWRVRVTLRVRESGLGEVELTCSGSGAVTNTARVFPPWIRERPVGGDSAAAERAGRQQFHDALLRPLMDYIYRQPAAS